MVNKSHLRKLIGARGPAVLRWSCSGVFLLLLASQGLLIARDVRTARTTQPAQTNLRLRPSTSPQALSDDVAAKHLFGASASDSGGQASPTYPSIEVLGMLSGDGSNGSWAILAIDGKQQIYKVGDSLPDGEKLAAVNAGSVTLDQNGGSRDITWDIQPAETNGRFATLALDAGATQVSGGDEGAETYSPALFHPSGPTSAKALRQELLSRPRFVPPIARPKPSKPPGMSPQH